MVKKADAWKEYQDAAMVDMFLETLPKVGAQSDFLKDCLYDASLSSCSSLFLVFSICLPAKGCSCDPLIAFRPDKHP